MTVPCRIKTYYDLLEAKQNKERQDIGIVRIEQIYPFESDQLQATLKDYPKAKQFIWVQEEPANMGAWPFLRSELQKTLDEEPRYIGRNAAAATAVGSHRRHQEEQRELIESAFVSKE